MIPKIIHYCWFGRGKKPKLADRCIASWQKYCPDYEIIEWNEDNFDVHLNDYTKFTYEHGKYAYLSDYVRLWAVEQYGGIYFDTDVELVKSLEDYRKYEAYFGFESNEFINSGIGFGGVAHSVAVQTMLQQYEKRSYKMLESEYLKYNVLTGSPKMNTYALTAYGLVQDGSRQKVLDAEILPVEYLCPFDDLTGELYITDHTLSIHWYSKSANSKFAAFKSRFSRRLHRAVKHLRGKNGKK